MLQLRISPGQRSRQFVRCCVTFILRLALKFPKDGNKDEKCLLDSSILSAVSASSSTPSAVGASASAMRSDCVLRCGDELQPRAHFRISTSFPDVDLHHLGYWRPTQRRWQRTFHQHGCRNEDHSRLGFALRQSHGTTFTNNSTSNPQTSPSSTTLIASVVLNRLERLPRDSDDSIAAPNILKNMRFLPPTFRADPAHMILCCLPLQFLSKKSSRVAASSCPV